MLTCMCVLGRQLLLAAYNAGKDFATWYISKILKNVLHEPALSIVVSQYDSDNRTISIFRFPVHHFRPLDVTDEGLLTIIKNPFLWIEIFLVGIHCPPYVNYQYGVLLMGNFTAYRIETMFACLNLLRLYLLWRSFSGCKSIPFGQMYHEKYELVARQAHECAAFVCLRNKYLRV